MKSIYVGDTKFPVLNTLNKATETTIKIDLRFIVAVEFRFCGMILVTGPLTRFVSIPSLAVRGERSFGRRFFGGSRLVFGKPRVCLFWGGFKHPQ